jgi:glutathione S-transferase
MPYVAIVTVLALLQYQWLGFSVGKARAKYNVPVPASGGNEMFDRHYRVHMNTLEQLVVFLPAMWMFAHMVSPLWAAGLGAVFIVGRFVFAAAYVRDPKSRSLGFTLTALPSMIMLLGTAVWAVRALAASISG